MNNATEGSILDKWYLVMPFRGFDVFCLKSALESVNTDRLRLSYALHVLSNTNPSDAWVGFKAAASDLNIEFGTTLRCLYVKRTKDRTTVSRREVTHDLFILPRDASDDLVPGIILGGISDTGIEVNADAA